jgi:RNA polymerase sigma-70 factor, ECF subfamily
VCSQCPSQLARDVVSAFPTFVAHHQDLVHGIARRWSRDPSDAEDLSQEAFIRAYRALGRYSPERRHALRTRGWMARIVVNLAHDRARGGDPPTAPLDASADRADIGAATPEATVDRHETNRMWRELLASLPPAYRTAVALRHVDGLSYPEVARALGRPLGTVKSDVHRGVRLLRLAFEARVAAEAADDPHRYTATDARAGRSIPPRANVEVTP